MADDNRKEEKQTQRSNELSWSSDPNYVPGQNASDTNPGDSQYNKTDPMRRNRPDEYYTGGTSDKPNQGSRPGGVNPAESDDDETIREPNTDDDDETKRGGMGRDRDTDPGEPGRGGMGGGGYER